MKHSYEYYAAIKIILPEYYLLTWEDYFKTYTKNPVTP